MKTNGRPSSIVRARVTRVSNQRSITKSDSVITEEPMEIRLIADGESQTVAVTMRTPGNDFELAAGFLFSESVLKHKHEVGRIKYCLDPDIDRDQHYNIVNVELTSPRLPQLEILERHFFTSSSCGVCGVASLEALELRSVAAVEAGFEIQSSMLLELPQSVRRQQTLFEATGGLHAAGLIDRDGRLLNLREDIGRHNAVDKLLGWAFLEDRLPLSDYLLFVTGRASFEILQKAAVAGIPMVAAVSAPTSLAVQLARAFNITLIGFLRSDQFNVYYDDERLTWISQEPVSPSA